MLQPVGEFRGLRLIGTLVCSIVSVCSLLVNFLPDTRHFKSGTRLCAVYSFFVHYVAFFALNWRTKLPSLDIEFMGFTRRMGHAVRNWQQDHFDRVERERDHASGVRVVSAKPDAP